MSDNTSIMKYKAVSATIVSCFYGDLMGFGKPCSTNGEEAFNHWSKMHEHTDSFESAKMKADLATLGMEVFKEGWEWLIHAYNVDPVKMKASLHSHYNPIVQQKMAEREKRGQG